MRNGGGEGGCAQQKGLRQLKASHAAAAWLPAETADCHFTICDAFTHHITFPLYQDGDKTPLNVLCSFNAVSAPPAYSVFSIGAIASRKQTTCRLNSACVQLVRHC